jgi:hypothetical protein
MAVTNELSTQAAIAADPSVGRITPTDSGFVRIARFSFTQGAAPGDATSTADLVVMPAGRVRVLGALSEIRFSAFGSSRTLDVGHPAAIDLAGDTITADPDAFLDGADVSAAGRAALTGEVLVETRAGFTVRATVAGGTIPAYVAYVMG